MHNKWKLGGMMLASLLTVASCQNEDIVSNEQVQGNYSLVVTNGVDSRTYVESDGTVKWSTGDKLFVYGTNVSGTLTLQGEGGATTGTFTGFVSGNPGNLKWAVFGDNVTKTSNGGAQFTISTISNPNSNSPMVGEIKDGEVNLNHLCGMVRITINDLPSTASVKLSGDNIAGTGEWNGTTMTVIEAKDEITIKVTDATDPTIEVPVFVTADDDSKTFTLTVDQATYTFSAPVAVGSLSEKVILALSCVVGEDGTVTDFEQAATTAESLKQALAALESGDELSISLADDITLGENEAIEIPANTTVNLDLNGNTITGASTKGEGALINNKGTLVIEGGELKNTEENGDAVVNNSGTLTLDGVTIEGASISTTSGHPEYAVVSSGILTIEEGTVISSDRGAISLQENGTTTINGGTFKTNSTPRAITSHVVDVEGVNNILTINGGTFQHLDEDTSGGVVICNRTTNTVYVNGGNFSGGNYYGNDNLSDYGYGGTFVVKGGTYSATPATKYIASGYIVTENGDGTSTVSPKISDDTDDVAAAITAGDKNVTLATNMTLDANTLSGADDLTINLEAGATITVAVVR